MRDLLNDKANRLEYTAYDGQYSTKYSPPCILTNFKQWRDFEHDDK